MRTATIARHLLATASALALSTVAHAACTANQAPTTTTAATGCITFNDGGAHTGAVTNPAGVTLAGTGAVAPTGTGISVRNATTLNGIITNNGTITSQSAFGIAAAGANTVIVGDIVNNGAIDNHNSTHSSIFVNSGVSLQAGAGGSGSIINTGSLTANSTSTGNAGIGVFSSALAGSITNAANATINARVGIRFDNFTNAIVGSGKVSLGGSIVNAGTITTLNAGIEVVGTNPVAGRPSTTGTLATISGGILNSGTIASGGDGVRILATNIGGDINNTKVITSGFNGIDISSLAQLVTNGPVVRFSNPSIGGSILNSGTITGGNGFADIFALSTTIAGGIVNNGSLVGGALSGSGIAVSDGASFSGRPSVSVGGRASIGGGIVNNGTISAGNNGRGIELIGFDPIAGGVTVAGGIVNNGTIGAASNSVLGFGVLLDGPVKVAGGITNAGSITARTGIGVVGGALVAGGITNTGTINSTIAIDFTELGAPEPPPGAPITINQNAGAITGAILLSNNADVLNLNGGTITGVVTGGGATTFNIVGGAFNVADQAANSVGTFKMTGGTINFGVTPNTAQHATITSQNAATVGGTFNVVEAGPPGSYAKTQTYTNVFIAPATTGTFNVTSASALFNASLVPGTAGGDLSLVLNFGLTGNTPNESATASALNPLLFAPANPNAAALLAAFSGVNSAQGPAALDLFSGEIHASVQTVLLDDSQFMRNGILGRLRQAAYAGAPGDIGALGFAGPVEVAEASSTAQQDAQAYAGATKAKRAAGAYAGIFPVKAKPAAPPDLTFWAQGIGAWGRIDGDGNAAGLSNTFGGFLSGVDTRLGTWRVGAAAGYSQSSISDRASSASVSTAHFGAYAATELGPLNIRTGAASAFSTVDTNRTIALPAFFDHDSARHDAKTAQVFGEVGQAMALGRFAAEPFAGLAYVWLNNDGFSETGGPAALTGAGNVDNLGYSTLGLRLATLYALPNGTTLVPRATLAWQHAFGTTTPMTTLAFQAGGTPFSIAGVPLARDSALVESGFDLRLTHRTKLGVAYTGELAPREQSHAVKGTYTWSF